MLRYVALRYVTLRYVTLRYITLHTWHAIVPWDDMARITIISRVRVRYKMNNQRGTERRYNHPIPNKSESNIGFY